MQVLSLVLGLWARTLFGCFFITFNNYLCKIPIVFNFLNCWLIKKRNSSNTRQECFCELVNCRYLSNCVIAIFVNERDILTNIKCRCFTWNYIITTKFNTKWSLFVSVYTGTYTFSLFLHLFLSWFSCYLFPQV